MQHDARGRCGDDPGLEAWLKKPLAISPLQQFHAMLEG
jgi:hypothetical protein